MSRPIASGPSRRVDVARRLIAMVAAFLAAAIPSSGLAAGTDCPLGKQPYSSRTIAADLLNDPDARAILGRDAPDLLAELSRNFGSAPIGPGFARIISPALLLRNRPDGQAITAKLDADLAQVALTSAKIRTRCSSYDQVPPRLPKDIRRPAILVFDKITGFRDTPSVDAATAAFKDIAARRGWTTIFSANGAVFNARDLARFDAVVWNNVSGDALTVPQQRAFKTWLQNGGGFAAFHGAGGDPVYVWDWYADTLIGARFVGHPMQPQFQAARVVVEDRASAITRGLAPEWTMTEEWYSFATSPRAKGAHILLTLDERSYSPVRNGQDLRMGDHPIAWTQCIGNGRAFYSAIGHRPEAYADANNLTLLANGIAWAAGAGETACARGREIARGLRTVGTPR